MTVDLQSLATCVCNFFEKLDFEILKESTCEGFEIIAADSPFYKMSGYVNVTIKGQQDNFVVSLDFCGDKESRRFSILFETMFGGGYWLLQRLKSNEAWFKLEREFWKYLDVELAYSK